MISDITIGQYFPSDSIIHKLDARIKIILTVLFVAAIFMCKNFVSMAVVFATSVAVVLLSKIKISIILKSVKPLFIVILFTSVINIFYGSGDPIASFWVFNITMDGIYRAVFMSVRIFLLVIVGSLLTYTTTPTALTDAIESLMKPLKIFKVDVHSFAMIMTIALRFIPTLVEEIDKIMAAQKSRGAAIDSGGFIRRAKAMVPVLIPLFVSAFRRATELAYAMECRCYRGGEGRTKMNVAHMIAKDYISLGVTIIFVASIVVINHFVSPII